MRRIALAEVALNAATDADDAVRNRGVRLVANKLYGKPGCPGAHSAGAVLNSVRRKVSLSDPVTPATRAS